ncbi:hypothetical protein SLS60_011533 [Paraconiothyrium brasiliense]|uniref:Zn(2)-C6 fungal-type domain-containing protein n=1 Tax=Paraconiothyrium brasiliense TaxID=300254 RepID=A0ABR3QIF7_9PLEO
MSARGGDSPSSIACLPCRTKHLKCDAQVPICGRCLRTATHCTFVRSRRGYQGRKRKRISAEPSYELPQLVDIIDVVPRTLDLNTIDIPTGFTVSEDQQTRTEETLSNPPVQPLAFKYDRLIDIYYRDIHPAHPFVLPRRMYLEGRNVLPVYLKTAMAFMASHLSPGSYEGLCEEATDSVFNSDAPDDIFKIQALMLLTLAFFARFERDRGNKALTEACTLASRLGLDTNASGEGQSAIYQESWRRTYWELYTITGLLSLITGKDVRMNCLEGMLLPGHCREYDECRVSERRDLRTMGFRMSLEDGFKWSSFAYKVEATRILNRVLERGEPDETLPDTQIQALSALITGFLFSLPEDKRTPITDNGGLDEVMSCALMIINLAGICLHFPRSSLARGARFKTVCGNDNRVSIESLDERFHRAIAIRYANGLSKLISSRHSLTTLTPCFSCAIAFAAAVHLAATLHHGSSEAQHKEHVQLELSALTVISRIWPIGGVVKSQIAQYSRELLAYRPPQGLQSYTSAQASNVALNIPNEPWLDDLTSQYMDMPSTTDLFNLMGPSLDSFNFLM